MKHLRPLLISLALSSLVTGACDSTGDLCEKAMDMELKCSDMSDEKKAEIKKMRSEFISMCKKSADSDKMKGELACAKKSDSCEEFSACQSEARAARRAEKLEETIAKNPGDAVSECTYSLEEYKASEKFRSICDKAFEKGFAGGLDKTAKSSLTYVCTDEKKSAEWFAASEPLKEGCKGLADGLRKEIVAARDSGADADFMACMDYKKLAPGPEAETLCAEASKAKQIADAIADAKKNLAAKKGSVPFSCNLAMDDHSGKLDKSEWFKQKKAELAEACYGNLGKLVLQNVKSFCIGDQKDTHKMAAEYGLGEKDPELKALLDKTSKKCGS